MTSSPLKSAYLYGLLPILILILDQSSKLWVYYNMVIGPAGEIRIFGDFFKLHYLTNPGMAFGLDIGGMYGKFALTFMRILVIGAIGYYFYKILLKGQRKGLIVAIASIFGGGMGNVIDSIFYGAWFGLTTDRASTPWFHGRVIDMFYVDIWEGILPEDVPILGGHYVFFLPVFNLADAAIILGITYILFQRKPSKKAPPAAAADPADPAPDDQPATDSSTLPPI